MTQTKCIRPYLDSNLRPHLVYHCATRPYYLVLIPPSSLAYSNFLRRILPLVIIVNARPRVEASARRGTGTMNQLRCCYLLPFRDLLCSLSVPPSLASHPFSSLHLGAAPAQFAHELPAVNHSARIVANSASGDVYC